MSCVVTDNYTGQAIPCLRGCWGTWRHFFSLGGNTNNDNLQTLLTIQADRVFWGLSGGIFFWSRLHFLGQGRMYGTSTIDVVFKFEVVFPFGRGYILEWGRGKMLNVWYLNFTDLRRAFEICEISLWRTLKNYKGSVALAHLWLQNCCTPSFISMSFNVL